MQKTPYVFPIIGGRKIEQLQQNIEALSISLTPEHIKFLDDASPFQPGFPYSGFVSLRILALTRCSYLTRSWTCRVTVLGTISWRILLANLTSGRFLRQSVPTTQLRRNFTVALRSGLAFASGTLMYTVSRDTNEELLWYAEAHRRVCKVGKTLE